MFLLYHERMAPTGRRLAAYLGIEHGTTLDGDAPQDVLIRWGSAVAVRRRPIRTINYRAAITLSSDKLNAFDRFIDAGVSCPRYGEVGQDLERPIIKRPRHGHGGRGIQFIMDGQRLPNLGDDEIFVEFIDKRREWRMHVFDGRIIKAQEKVYQGDGPRRNPIVWNHDNGYVFTEHPRGEVSTRIKTTAVAAVAALDLNFGAVDIITGDAPNEVYILEVNTAPGLIPTTLTTYGDAIARAIGITPVGMDAVDWPADTPGLENRT